MGARNYCTPMPASRPPSTRVIAAGAKRGSVRDQECGQLGHFFRRPNASQRMSLAPTFEHCGERNSGCEVSRRTLEHRGAYRPRANRIHSYIVGCVVERQSACQAVHGALDVAYATTPTLARCPCTDARLMIAPPPPLFHLRHSVVGQKITLPTFTIRQRFQVSRSVSTAVPKG